MRVTILAFALLGLGACDAGTEDRPQVSSTRVVMRPNEPVPRGTAPTPALLRRGEERFLAFCSPCHGRSGRGDGVVVSHGFPAPPSYFDERLRAAPAEHVVTVITRGVGRMYPYADRVPPEDRWAIAHYVKALQAGEPPVRSP